MTSPTRSLRVPSREATEPARSEHDARERAVATLATGQHGLVTARQLAAAGLRPASVAHRVRQRRLTRVHRGVYVVGAVPLSPAARRLAAVLACGTGAAASHVAGASASTLLSVRGGAIHVTVPPGNGSASRAGIRVHRGRSLSERDVIVVDGCRVTSVARTLVDLGDVVPPQVVRRAFVRAAQLRLIDMAQVDAVLGDAGRRSGARALRELLKGYDPRWAQTRSELELALLDLLASLGLPEPEVNAWLLGRFLVDFVWREARLVVETDGCTYTGPRTRGDLMRAATTR
jgi:uncharacterized metal-binding protein